MSKKLKRNNKHLFEDGGDSINYANTAMHLNNMLNTDLNLSSIADIQKNIEANRMTGINGKSTIGGVTDMYNNYSSLDNLTLKDIQKNSIGDKVGGIGQSMVEGASALQDYGDYGALIGGVIGLGSGLFSAIAGDRKAKRTLNALNKNIDNMNAYNQNVMANNAKSAIANQFNDLQSQLFALGGNLSTHGGDFNNGVTFINNGNTHEKNPNDGVQMGIAPDGLPNLVEEGEVVFNNYVFSNRLSPNKAIRQKYKLQDKITFAEAAKKIQKESEERPNDPISKRGLNVMLGELAQNQEDIKLAKQAREARKQLNRLSDEELLALQQQMANEGNPQQFKNGGCMGHKYGLGDTIQLGYYPKNNTLNNLNGVLGNPIDLSYLSPTELQGFKDYAPHDLAPAPVTPIWEDPAFKELTRKEMGNLLYDNNNNVIGVNPAYSNVDKVMQAPNNTGKTTGYNLSTAVDSTPMETGHQKEAVMDEEGATGVPDWYQDKIKDYQTWMRYAPVVGSALGLGLSIFDKPRYKYANQLEQVANEIGKPIDFTPIGDYLQYTPLDRNYYLNQLRSSAAGSRRALLNSSNLNRGQAAANILASDYNTIGSIGKLAREAEEYNMAQREKVATFNRGTNQYNSEGRLKTDMANQDSAYRKSSVLAQALAMKQAEDDRYRAGIAANATNLFDNIGNIGRENFFFNQVNKNPALLYDTNKKADVKYKVKE